MVDLIHVEWCTFCGSRESEGYLKVDMGQDGIEDFPSCKQCAINLSKGYEVDGL